MIRQTCCVLFLLSILSIGCTTTQKQYYFGEYSNTLYGFEKSRNEETLLQHKEELENIISESTEKNLYVPPGIYAELGYIYMRQNNPDKAFELFKKETDLYPESKQFMDRLIQRTINTKS